MFIDGFEVIYLEEGFVSEVHRQPGDELYICTTTNYDIIIFDVEVSQYLEFRNHPSLDALELILNSHPHQKIPKG